MAYTYESLISDLEHNENWNVIRERANDEKLDLKHVPDGHRATVKKALDEYFKRKYENQELNPNMHYDISHFCKEKVMR